VGGKSGAAARRCLRKDYIEPVPRKRTFEAFGPFDQASRFRECLIEPELHDLIGAFQAVEIHVPEFAARP